jgi:hypothetical protein
MHLKYGRSAGNAAYTWKGTTSKAMVAIRPKVSFWLDGTCPGNYGWIFVFAERHNKNIIICTKCDEAVKCCVLCNFLFLY